MCLVYRSISLQRTLTHNDTSDSYKNVNEKDICSLKFYCRQTFPMDRTDQTIQFNYRET